MRMNDFRQWAVRVDGEVLFDMTGPNAEAIVRAAAARECGVVVYRDHEGPTDDYPASHWGAWQEAEPAAPDAPTGGED